MTEENFEYRLIGRMKLHGNDETMTYGAFATPQYGEGEFSNCGVGTHYGFSRSKNIVIPAFKVVNFYFLHYLDNVFGLMIKGLVEKFITHFKLIMGEHIYTPGNEDFMTYLALSISTFNTEEIQVIMLYRMLMLEIQFKKVHEAFPDYIETKWGKDIPGLTIQLYQKYNDILMENSDNNNIAFAMRNIDMNADACICKVNLKYNCPITINIHKKFRESIRIQKQDLNNFTKIEKIRFTACVNKRTLVMSIDARHSLKTIICISLVEDDASRQEYPTPIKEEYLIFGMKIINLIRRSSKGRIFIVDNNKYQFRNQPRCIKNIIWKYRLIKDERTRSILTKYNHFEVESLMVTLRLKYYFDNDENAEKSWTISQKDEFDILLMLAWDGFKGEFIERKEIIKFIPQRESLRTKFFPPPILQLNDGFNRPGGVNTSTETQPISLNRPNVTENIMNISEPGQSVENDPGNNLIKPGQQLGIEHLEQKIDLGGRLTQTNENFTMKDTRDYEQEKPSNQTNSKVITDFRDKTSGYMISITDEPLNLTTYRQDHQSIAMSCTNTELNKSENYTQLEPLDLTINKEVYIKMKVEK